MLKFKRHIIFTFGLLIISGLISSSVHYHSDGLECVDHAQEAHYVQNEITCPVSSLVVHFNFDRSLSFDGFIAPEEVLVLETPNHSSEEHFSLFLGRDPPLPA